jgi:hypothetical protein
MKIYVVSLLAIGMLVGVAGPALALQTASTCAGYQESTANRCSGVWSGSHICIGYHYENIPGQENCLGVQI